MVPSPKVSEVLGRVEERGEPRDKADRMLEKSQNTQRQQELENADREIWRGIEELRADAERTREARERSQTEKLSADI